MCYFCSHSSPSKFLLNPSVCLGTTLEVIPVSSVSLLAHIQTIRKFCLSTIKIHILFNQFSPPVLMKPCPNHHQLSTYYNHLLSGLSASMLAFLQFLLTWHCHILFTTGELPNPAHTRGERMTQQCKYKKAGIFGGHSRSRLH